MLIERGLVGSFDEGVELLRSARPGVGLHKGQEAFMRDYIDQRDAVG
jgi:hypothetical protein